MWHFLFRTGAQVDQSVPFTTVFAQLQYSDLWEDAVMSEVVRYARGSKYLCIPPEWRPLMPTHL